EASGAAERASTDEGGRFALSGGSAAGGATLRVDAPGYVRWERALGPADFSGEIAVILSADRASEEVTVTAARIPRTVGETAASVLVLGRADIAVTAAP